MKLTALGILAAMVPAVAAAQASGITPGEWDIAVTMNNVEMAGNPDVARMMKGKTTRVRHCITVADAARGPQDMLGATKGCKFTRYTMVAGRLTAAMTCQQPGGGTMTGSSTGTFTPTAFTASGQSSITGGAMQMKMSSTTVGKRLGPCKK